MNHALWILSIRLEEQLRGVNKARSMAEMARYINEYINTTVL